MERHILGCAKPMLKNHFTIALRHLQKQKMYSAIKIGGFALSIAACLLIALYIRDELSYDRSYPDTARLYRITGEHDHDGKIEKRAVWPPPLAKGFGEDFPEGQRSRGLHPTPTLSAAAP